MCVRMGFECECVCVGVGVGVYGQAFVPLSLCVSLSLYACVSVVSRCIDLTKTVMHAVFFSLSAMSRAVNPYVVSYSLG